MHLDPRRRGRSSGHWRTRDHRAGGRFGCDCRRLRSRRSRHDIGALARLRHNAARCCLGRHIRNSRSRWSCRRLRRSRRDCRGNRRRRKRLRVRPPPDARWPALPLPEALRWFPGPMLAQAWRRARWPLAVAPRACAARAQPLPCAAEWRASRRRVWTPATSRCVAPTLPVWWTCCRRCGCCRDGSTPRTRSASSPSRELECVLTPPTPTSLSESRIALLFTSSSRARSLIRTLLIRPFYGTAPSALSSS